MDIKRSYEEFFIVTLYFNDMFDGSNDSEMIDTTKGWLSFTLILNTTCKELTSSRIGLDDSLSSLKGQNWPRLFLGLSQ